jgi:hypothetical protein
MVAKELGFRYADEEIIARAAETAGVSPEAVAQAEETPGLIVRILEAMAKTPIDPEGWSGYAAAQTPRSAGYEALIARVIGETAEAGSVVIVAHGASVPLAGREGLLRVLVTASSDVRVERLGKEAGLGDGEAEKAIRESDRQRREYLRRFYNVREELPTHYDLVINTDSVTPKLAAALIARAAKG